MRRCAVLRDRVRRRRARRRASAARARRAARCARRCAARGCRRAGSAATACAARARVPSAGASARGTKSTGTNHARPSRTGGAGSEISRPPTEARLWPGVSTMVCVARGDGQAAGRGCLRGPSARRASPGRRARTSPGPPSCRVASGRRPFARQHGVRRGGGGSLGGWSPAEEREQHSHRGGAESSEVQQNNDTGIRDLEIRD